MKVLKPVFILLSNFELEYLREFLSYNGEFYIIGFLRLWRIQWCNRFQIPITGCRNIVVFHSCLKSRFLTFSTKFFGGLTLITNISVSFCCITGKLIYLDSLGYEESNGINFFGVSITSWRDIGVSHLWLRIFRFGVFIFHKIFVEL